MTNQPIDPSILIGMDEEEHHHHSHHHSHHSEHRSHHHSKHKRKRNTKRVLLIILILLLVLALLAGGTVWWMYRQGQKDLLEVEPPMIIPPQELVDSNDGDTVVYNGVTYKYNYNVTAVLVMGIDKEDIQEDSTYGQNGQADSLFLATLDTEKGDVNIIPISREAMVDVDQYAVDGTYLGVTNTQLCLAYAYATDGVGGCENMVRSTSRLLYGVPINSYVAIDMDGVRAITDHIGGVNVTAMETIRDPLYKNTICTEGEQITLQGRNTLVYLRHRGTDAGANNRRMQRMKQFFTAFIAKAGGNVKKDPTQLAKYYNTVSPYVVTDISLSKMTYLAGRTLSGNNWSNPRYISIEGESVAGPEHNEFHVDEVSAYEAVLAAFYTPVETATTTTPATAE